MEKKYKWTKNETIALLEQECVDCSIPSEDNCRQCIENKKENDN